VPSGKYEMATIVLRQCDSVPPAVVRRLAAAAHALNVALGDPRAAASKRKQAPTRKPAANAQRGASAATRRTPSSPRS
jgi:hypothetical protein